MSTVSAEIALQQIIQQYGRQVVREPGRVEGLLHDLCPMAKREVNLLVGALQEGVPSELIAASTAGQLSLDLFPRLASTLESGLAVTPQAAQWAVDTWAAALGIARPQYPPSPIGGASPFRPQPPKPKPVFPIPAAIAGAIALLVIGAATWSKLHAPPQPPDNRAGTTGGSPAGQTDASISTGGTSTTGDTPSSGGSTSTTSDTSPTTGETPSPSTTGDTPSPPNGASDAGGQTPVLRPFHLQTPPTATDDDLIGSQRLLTRLDLVFKTPHELRIIRNAIYARHGYIFHDPDLRRYFEAKPWYRPSTSDQDLVSRDFSFIERHNAALLRDYESEQRQR